MIISDLNHLETLSEAQNIEGGNLDLLDWGYLTTPVNAEIIEELASSAVWLYSPE